MSRSQNPHPTGSDQAPWRLRGEAEEKLGLENGPLANPWEKPLQALVGNVGLGQV